jgi:hypothetical protein
MFRSWPRWVKFALDTKARVPSTTTHFACRLRPNGVEPQLEPIAGPPYNAEPMKFSVFLLG